MAPPMRIILSLFVSLSIACLWLFRPTHFRTRQHLFDELTSLRENFIVIATEGTEDELRQPGVDIFGNAREDRIGVADRECMHGVAPGAFGVGLHRLTDRWRIPAAEVERKAGALVVIVHGSAGFAGGSLDRGHDAAGLGGPLAAGLPAGADARRAPD